MKNKRTIAAAIITIMIISGTKVYADPLSGRLKSQQSELQQSRDTYDDLEGKIQQSESDIQKMDEQINDLLGQTDEIKTKINQCQQDIRNMESSIEKCQADLDAEKESFNKRARALYMAGSVGYLDVILESSDFADFISRMDLLSKVIKYDNDLMNGLKAKRDEIKRKKQEMDDKNKQLLSLQKQNQDKLAELNALKASQGSKLEELRIQQSLYASNIAKYQAQVNETLAQIKAMKEAAKQPKNNGTTILASRGTGGNTPGEAIVAYASDFLGIPYVWGGNTPAGFDCSGFTKYVFAHFGITLNRRASQQAMQGVPVSRDNLEPGDLVFFGNPVYHVGIYVGNGCFIHAPSTGDVVRIAPLKWMDYTGARRIR